MGLNVHYRKVTLDPRMIFLSKSDNFFYIDNGLIIDLQLTFFFGPDYYFFINLYN